FDDLGAHNDVVLQSLAAEVQVAIAKSNGFFDVDVAVHLEGQGSCRVEDLDRLNDELDLAGGHARVLGTFWAPANLTFYLEHELRACLAGHPMRLRRQLGVEHDLRQARSVAEIDEDQTAMVPPPVNPALE